MNPQPPCASDPAFATAPPAIAFRASRNYSEYGRSYRDVDVAGVPQDETNYFTVKFLSARRLEITSLGIPCGEQRRGFGRRAVEALEKWCRETGIRSIHLESVEDSVGFWEKMGFRRSPRRASESDWTRMVKELV